MGYKKMISEIRKATGDLFNAFSDEATEFLFSHARIENNDSCSYIWEKLAIAAINEGKYECTVEITQYLIGLREE